MGHLWVLDVLTDLTRYAQDNGLHRLETQLLDAARTARVDISDSTGGGGDTGDRDERALRSFSGAAGGRHSTG